MRPNIGGYLPNTAPVITAELPWILEKRVMDCFSFSTILPAKAAPPGYEHCLGPWSLASPRQSVATKEAPCLHRPLWRVIVAPIYGPPRYVASAGLAFHEIAGPASGAHRAAALQPPHRGGLRLLVPCVRFHGLRRPAEMGAPEVESCLGWLACDRKVSASTHRQALSALLFLYSKVLAVQLPWMNDLGACRTCSATY